MQRILLVTAALAIQTIVSADEPADQVSTGHSQRRRYHGDRPEQPGRPGGIRVA